MKLIIDIPEDVYKKTIFYREFRDINDCVTTLKALENGIPLSEELEKIIAKIDFEEKWLLDVYEKQYRVSAKDIEIAMSGIRRVVAELKGENK